MENKHKLYHQMASLTGLLRSERQKKVHKPSQNAIFNREDDDQTIGSISFLGGYSIFKAKNPRTRPALLGNFQRHELCLRSLQRALQCFSRASHGDLRARHLGTAPQSWKQGSIFVGGAHDNTMHMYIIHDTSQIMNWIAFASGDAYISWSPKKFRAPPLAAAAPLRNFGTGRRGDPARQALKWRLANLLQF